MRLFTAALIVATILYFWYKDNNNGRLFDGSDSMRRSMAPRYADGHGISWRTPRISHWFGSP